MLKDLHKSQLSIQCWINLQLLLDLVEDSLSFEKVDELFQVCGVALSRFRKSPEEGLHDAETVVPGGLVFSEHKLFEGVRQPCLNKLAQKLELRGIGNRQKVVG